MSQSTEEESVLELNDKQADFTEAVLYDLTAEGTKTAAMIGGIGSGKSVEMALLMQKSIEELPRAKGQFACLFVTQFKRAIFPGVKSVWREHFGLVEYDFKTGEGDYCLWRKPPDDWDKPYQEPDDWANCISYPNGWVMEVCAYKMNADIHRGRNDDFAFMDEGLLFLRDWLKILEGRIRANKGKFDSNLHWLVAIFSSPPYGATGEWMFEIEDFMMEEPDRYLFMQVTTMDNMAFLPSNFVANLKKKLTKLEYNVEVLGHKLSKIPKGFYPSFDEHRHMAIDDEGFYDLDKEVAAVVDFNAHFTSCTVWQDYGKPQHCVMDCFVHDPFADMTMAQSLGVELLERLGSHRKRTIHITGDRNGLNASANSKKKADGAWQTMFDDFAKAFEDAGWEVMLSPLMYNPLKDEVYTLMQGILSETRDDGLHMRFHPTHAKSTTISIQRTPILPDYKKNKGSEKTGENQEYATHLSDTVDYYATWRCLGGMVMSGDMGFEIDFL